MGVVVKNSRQFAKKSYAKPKNQWKAFDELPRTVREALANAAFDWAAYPVWRWWNSGQYKSAKDLAKQIAVWDKTQIKKDSNRVWGIS